MARSRKYFTLVLRDDGDRRWRIEFGDYDRSVVKAEMDSYTEHDYLKSNAKIIETGETQAEIEQAVKELNDEN